MRAGPRCPPRGSSRTRRSPTSSHGSAWAPPGPPAPRTPSPRPTRRARHTPKHWAFQPVTDPTPPEVKDRDWPRDAIDRFVLAKLEAKGLTPSPAADKRTLIRRATFDLIGLPPTPEEVEAFVADASPDAFEQVVDRLLASPHYGERWGRHWLDVARYADTKGYVLFQDAQLPLVVHLSRLRHPRLQRRPALRPVRHRADRRRPAPARRGQAPAGGPGVPDARRAVPEQPARHHRRPDRRRDARPDGPDRHLRPLPRPQVRPDPDGRLLLAVRRLRQLDRAPRPADLPGASRGPRNTPATRRR